MALYASGVQINPTLSGAISGQGSPGYNAYNTINKNYAGAQQGLANDAAARGMNPAGSVGPNSYAGNRFATTQGLDTGNLESALGGGLGNTAYQNALAQRDYTQNVGLANEVGALNKPNLLQQVLGGIGNVGGTAAQVYGAWGKNGTPSTPQPGGGGFNANGPLSLFNPSASGLGRYSQ